MACVEGKRDIHCFQLLSWIPFLVLLVNIRQVVGQAAIDMCFSNGTAFTDNLLYLNLLVSDTQDGTHSGCACNIHRKLQYIMSFRMTEFQCGSAEEDCSWRVQLYIDDCFYGQYCCGDAGKNRAFQITQSRAGQNMFLRLVPNPGSPKTSVNANIRFIAAVPPGTDSSTVVTTECGQPPNPTDRELHDGTCPTPSPTDPSAPKSTTTTTPTPTPTRAMSNNTPRPSALASSTPSASSSASQALSTSTSKPMAQSGGDSDDFPIIPVAAGVIAGVVFIVILLIIIACCCHYRRNSEKENSDKESTKELADVPAAIPSHYSYANTKETPNGNQNGHIPRDTIYENHNAVESEYSNAPGPSEDANSAIAVGNNVQGDRTSRVQLLHDDDYLEDPAYSSLGVHQPQRMVMSQDAQPYSQGQGQSQDQNQGQDQPRPESIYAQVKKRPKSTLTQDDWNKAVDENFDFMDNDMYNM